MKEIRITIINENWERRFRTSGIPEIVLQNHESLFRNEVEGKWKKGIEIEEIDNNDAVAVKFSWFYKDSDHDNYHEKISDIVKKLDH